MMLKHLGMFGVLAVCLFAMAMVGCSQGNKPIDKPIIARCLHRRLRGWF